MVRNGQAGDAIEACRQALVAEPGSLDAYYMLAVAHAAINEHVEAVEACDAALAQSPGYLRARLQKAQSLMALGNRAEAVVEALAAAEANPSDAFSLNAIGVTLTRAGDHERAVEFYQRAANAGGAPAHYYNLAVALATVGRLDEARAAHRACLKRDPMHAQAWLSLVQITNQTSDDNNVAALEAAFTRAKGHPALTQDIGHALAKSWEDMGEPGKAMDWLARAKAGMRTASRHSPEKDAALFAAAKSAGQVGCASNAANVGPIFIVGLPRTGTTLVERILTSHSAISTAGELPDFPEAIRSVAGLGGQALFSTELVSESAVVEAGDVGARYLANVKARLGLTGRIVDKLPVNFFLVPSILRALPDARVVCLRRHPADAMLASYRQVFARGARYLDYALDLEWAAAYVAGFERLAKVWSETFPTERYCEVSYEQVVDDLEGQTRRLLDFCGVPFEQACVAFHQNASPVATASVAQVRSPLYATSVGKWRHYRPGIDHGVQRLIELGAMTRDELDK